MNSITVYADRVNPRLGRVIVENLGNATDVTLVVGDTQVRLTPDAANCVADALRRFSAVAAGHQPRPCPSCEQGRLVGDELVCVICAHEDETGVRR